MRLKIMFVLLAAALCAAFAPQAHAGSVQVTYLGNEGFALQAGETRVLIDALQGSGVPGYETLPIEPRLELESAKGPYANVQLALATHGHEDHFDPLAVGRFLTANEKAIFASTEQAGLGMFMDVKNYDALKPRIRRLKPGRHERIKVELAGLEVVTFPLPHGTTEHLGFILELDGLRILHIGDSSAHATHFRKLFIPDEEFDIAFVPFWYFHYRQWMMAFEDSIRTKQVVVMHIPAEDAPKNMIGKAGSRKELVAQIRKQFPDVVIFDRPLESRTLGGGSD